MFRARRHTDSITDGKERARLTLNRKKLSSAKTKRELNEREPEQCSASVFVHYISDRNIFASGATCAGVFGKKKQKCQRKRERERNGLFRGNRTYLPPTFFFSFFFFIFLVRIHRNPFGGQYWSKYNAFTGHNRHTHRADAFRIQYNNMTAWTKLFGEPWLRCRVSLGHSRAHDTAKKQ